MKIKKTVGDHVFNAITYIVMTFVLVVTLYPFWYVVVGSVSSMAHLIKNGFVLWPDGLHLDAYEQVFRNDLVPVAYRNTLIVTLGGTALSMLLTILGGFVLSLKKLPGRVFFTFFFVFTMMFGGGLVPTFLVVSSLGMIDTLWALIIPGAISTYNMILMRTYFSSIPDALRESATIDGANDFVTLTRIMLPLSKSMLATIALFYAVGRWNAVTDGMIYINEPEKYILQVRLKNIILNAQGLDELMAEGANMEFSLNTTQMRCATLMFSLIPVLIVYPFLQKYFVKGVMIGSVKG